MLISTELWFVGYAANTQTLGNVFTDLRGAVPYEPECCFTALSDDNGDRCTDAPDKFPYEISSQYSRGYQYPVVYARPTA